MPVCYYRYDNLALGLPALGVAYDDPSKKVVATYEQENVMHDLKIYREWFEKGYINQDAATLGELPTYQVCNIAQGWSQAAQTTWGPNMGVNATAVQWRDTIVSRGSVQGSINCISANSKHPEEALRFLNLVNSDTYVRDALYYGLEGDNFNYTADKKVERTDKQWFMAGYSQGTFFNVSLLADQETNQWDEVKELNEKAEASRLFQFLSIQQSLKMSWQTVQRFTTDIRVRLTQVQLIQKKLFRK